MATQSRQHHARILKKMFIISGGILFVLLILTLGLYIWFTTSPYLSAMLVRHSFEQGGEASNAILEKYAPKYVPTITNIHYRDNDPDALLDIYYTKQDASQAPTVLWVHGGGWLAGNKNDLSPWARILTNKGFNVIALNYSIAPEHTYPLPTVQLNAALGFLNTRANEFGLNLNKLVLGGDSAGAQIIAQASLIETNPAYAKDIGISKQLTNGKIRALLLNCGPYDLSLINPESQSDGAKLVRMFMWAYTGNKDYNKTPGIKYLSIPTFVTKDFPPSFITAGNIDPLLPHSKKLAESLKTAGVTTDTLFYPDAYKPALNHEYQFNLDTKEGAEALERMVTFTNEQTSNVAQ